jgi:hypothetical protein
MQATIRSPQMRPLTQTQKRTLAFIHAHPECTPQQMAAAFGYGPRCKYGIIQRLSMSPESQVGAIVGKLAKRGLIRRAVRPVAYRLTRVGETALVAAPYVEDPNRQNKEDWDDVSVWGSAAARRVRIPVQVVSDIYWLMNLGFTCADVSLLTQEGLVGGGKFSTKGRALASEVMGVFVRWRNGLPPDTDLGFIKKKCRFKEGDILEWQGKQCRVEIGLDCCGLTEGLPGTTQRPGRTSLLFWYDRGAFCHRVGCEGAPISQRPEGSTI